MNAHHTIPLATVCDAAIFQDRKSSRQKAFLVKIYPAVVSGSLIALDDRDFIFGRDESCDYELSDNFSSRKHAVLQRSGEHYSISDLGSTNGTFVNGVRTTFHDLENGDQIRIGTQIFKFLSSDDVEAMYHEAVFQMMTVDALTQTYNRRYFEDVLRREIDRSKRHNWQLGLIMLDIDHFKELNDTYGHLVGDEILAELCKRISPQIRSGDIFARIGGDEFVIAVIASSDDTIGALGDRVCEVVRRSPIITSRGAVSVTISAGGACPALSEECNSIKLCEMADTSLYAAKQQGRNRYCNSRKP